MQSWRPSAEQFSETDLQVQASQHAFPLKRFGASALTRTAVHCMTWLLRLR